MRGFPPRIGSGSNAIASTPPSRLACVILTSPPFLLNSFSNSSRIRFSKSSQSIAARFVLSFSDSTTLCEPTKRGSSRFKLKTGRTGLKSISLLPEIPFSDLKHSFRSLKGISGSKLIDFSPVRPVLSLNREDPRFVGSHNVVESLNDKTNLAAMDWLDFENLIRELFEKEFSKNGGEVKITQASRDGGVDAIAFDPDPIRGGKPLIQPKRYTNTLGAAAVRDLFRTAPHETP